MFRKGGDTSPEVQRHAFGEAPMLLDAALRDAQIREEAERAYDEIQLHRSRSVGEKYVPSYLHLLPPLTNLPHLPGKISTSLRHQAVPYLTRCHRSRL